MQKRIILGILIIIWMITIFLFSNQDGMESENTSDIITNRLVNETIENDIEIEENVDNTNNENINNSVNVAKYNYEFEMYKGEVRLVVRKSAHFIIYLVGGFLLFNFFRTYNISLRNQIIYAILGIILYASSDEFHQLFVNGRTARVEDVLLDTLGAIVGILINIIFLKIICKMKNKKDKALDDTSKLSKEN